MPNVYDDEGSHVGDKHKKIIRLDDSQSGVEIEPSLAESSAPSYSLFETVIDEIKIHQSVGESSSGSLDTSPIPEREEAEETETSFPDAWSMIVFPNLKASLDQALENLGQRSPFLIGSFIHSFESPFSGVSFTWEDIFNDPFSSTLDVSLCPAYRELVDWIAKHGPNLNILGDFVAWSFGHILESLFPCPGNKGHSPTPLSDVSIFSALALVLHSHPEILPMKSSKLIKFHLWYQEKGAVTCPIRVWMIYQVYYGNLHAALLSWVHFLLPELQVVPSDPHSRDLILKLVEKIFEKPEAQTQLVESPTYLGSNQLLGRRLFEILLRVTFPAASSATEKDTMRLLKIYTSLKEVALACALLHEQLTKNMFTLSLRLAGEGNPVLAKEAIEIAIWSMKNADCGEDWYDLCTENLEASVALLKMLPEYEKLNLHLLPSSNKATPDFIQQIFTVSLRLAGEGNTVLAKEAAKISIWSLTKNVNCWSHLGYLYKKNLEASVALLKALVDEWPDLSLKLSSSRKQFIERIFTISLRLAGEDNPVLAEEAIAISIWSLTKNIDCCTHWDNLYKENIKASLALLRKLVHEWKDNSLKLSLSPTDALTLSQTIKSFRLKNQKAIAEGGANGYICKEADKFCKVTLGRLSPESCSNLRGAGISAVVIVAALAPFYLTMPVFCK